METKEKNLEQDIESWLLSEGGYVKGNMWTYDKKKAIDMSTLICHRDRWVTYLEWFHTFANHFRHWWWKMEDGRVFLS